MNKEKWEIKKLGEVCSYFNDGNWIESKDQSEDGIRLVQTGNIGNGFFQDKGERARFISEDTFKTLNCTEVLPNDVLISRLPDPIGRACIVPNIGVKMITAVDCTIARFKENILNTYVVYYTKSNEYKRKINTFSTGTTRKRISRANLSNIQIPIPPLSTQEKIVSELDTLHRLKELQEQQLAELDNLAQSTFYHLFGDRIENEKGWEVKTIENICSSLVRGPFGSALKKEFFVPKSNTTFKIYEQKNAIQNNAYIGDYYIDNERHKSLTRFTVLPNDIIMSCSGTIGKLLVIPKNAEKGIINQALLKFSLNKSITISFFIFLMNKLIDSLDKKGSGIQNLGSVGYIKALSFGLPPLSLQTQFTSRIEKIETQKELIKQSIGETQLLIDYTMDKYFG